MDWNEVVQRFADQKADTMGKYSPAGKTFSADNEEYQGHYWYYRGTDFIIDIHSLHFHQEYCMDSMPDIQTCVSLLTSYVFSGSGEYFNPYQSIEPNSVMILDSAGPRQRCIFHGGSDYFTVGINYSDELVQKYLCHPLHRAKNEMIDFILQAQNAASRQIHKLASEIVACKLEGSAADLFFEAKAKEWLSIVLNACQQHEKAGSISETDSQLLDTVARYISEHYILDIPQQILENISLMSGTKLKASFQKKFGMSITEFTQRRRMEVANHLLLTTDLEIGTIAEAVGYRSHSRFSTLFRRYKGVYPKEVQQKRSR